MAMRLGVAWQAENLGLEFGPDDHLTAAFRSRCRPEALAPTSKPAGVGAKTIPCSAGALKSRETSFALRQASKSARSNGGENLRPMLSVNWRGLPSACFCQIPLAFTTRWPSSATMRARRSIDGTQMPNLRSSSKFWPAGAPPYSRSFD